MTTARRSLLGRTPRQRRLRLGELVLFVLVLLLIGLGLTGRIDGRPLAATLYLSTFVGILILWLGLVLLDLREGLRYVVERETGSHPGPGLREPGPDR